MNEIKIKDRVRISVIVPVKNGESHIEACIQALQSQEYPADQYEILMVDDHSGDASAAIIKKHPDIVYLKPDKQGPYAARNFGIEHAEGDIQAFTDADCVTAPDWLTRIDAVMRDPEIHVVLGRNRFATDSLILAMLAGYEAEKTAYACASQDRTVYYGYTNNLATRKVTLNRVGVFSEIPRGADVVFVRRVVDEYSCEAVTFSKNICVRHLEITNPTTYFRKQFIYGKSIQAYGRISGARALMASERLRVFRATLEKNHFSLIKSCLLFFVLTIGAIYYELGRIGASRVDARKRKNEKRLSVLRG